MPKFHAKKSLGQNFLVDARYAERIVDAVSPVASDLVVEVGPGQGALTAGLVARAGHTLAVELDPRMRDELVGRFPAERFTFREADVLELDLTGEVRAMRSDRPSLDRVRLAANLPYYISSPVIAHTIAHRGAFFDATVMLQREVVDRLVARPGGKDYGALSVLVAMYCRAERLFDVPPGAFRPVPSVVSSVVRLTMLPAPAVGVPDEDFFFRLVRGSFAQRRKTLDNNLSAAGFAGLAARAGIDGRRRAETLSIDEFAALALAAS